MACDCHELAFVRRCSWLANGGAERQTWLVRASRVPPLQKTKFASMSYTSFRVKVPALWRQVFPIGLLITALFRGASWLRGEPFSWPSTLPLALTAGLVVMAFYFLRATQAGADGLKLLSRLGHRRFVSWADVSEVSFGHRQPLEPNFRVTDRQRRVHWIPRHTKDLRLLQKLASQFGGPDHVLALMLETPLCDAP
jgi:hypothetical protein